MKKKQKVEEKKHAKVFFVVIFWSKNKSKRLLFLERS